MNIRRRIFLLNSLTLIPVILFVIYLNIVSYKKSENEARKDIENITHIVAAENLQIIESMRQLLLTLSVTPVIQNTNNLCSIYLSELLSKYQRYGNFGVASSNGNLVCSAIKNNEKINLSDRLFFKKTIETNDYSVGEYVISKSTNKASINFGYPLLGKNNGVVYATLNLDWLNQLIGDLEIDKNVVVTILDKNGVVLARTPDIENLIGSAFPNDPLLKQLGDSEGIVDTLGIDEKPRIYAYEKIFEENDQGLYIVAGKSKKDIAKEIRGELIKNILISIIITIFSLTVGLIVGNSLITKTIEKLKEVDNLRKDFISLISHQIRTPATSIKWFVEILLSGSQGTLKKKQKIILKDIYSSTNRMVELVSNILSITKLETGKIDLQIKNVDINKMILDINKSIHKEFKNKLVKVELNSRKNVPKIVDIDEKLFYQAIFNIVHNAIKYSHKGGVVKINIEKVNKNITIKISDDGIGIPKNEVKNMFKKFSRATNANSSDTGGAGLGLYLSKLIISAHKGTITLGKQKKGTLVLISIPLR